MADQQAKYIFINISQQDIPLTEMGLMRRFDDDVGSFCVVEDVIPSILRLCNLIKEYPQLLNPFRGEDDEMKMIYSAGGFDLYPTVKKTTILYDREQGYFIKILHPLTVKDRIRFLLTDRAGKIFNLSERLRGKGVKVVEVVGYGRLKNGKRQLYIMKRVRGRSLYDTLVKEKETVDILLLQKVMDAIAGLHKLGYWLGDAHLSHIFVDGTDVSGFIDIDGIRRNRFLNTRRMAKDIAGLNYPGISITDEEKDLLINYYMNRADIKDRKGFLKILKTSAKKRWG